MEDYLKLVDSFFTFKNGYESKYKESVRKIMKKGLSKQEKRKAIAAIPRKCIQCKKKGGTIFEITPDHYKAVCNVHSGPCSLNLTIPRTKYYNKRDYLTDFRDELLQTERDIIEMKLKQIFEYISAEDLVELFEEKSESYKVTNQVISMFEKENAEMYDSNGIEMKRVEIQDLRNTLDELYQSYKNTNEDKYLDDMVEQNMFLMNAENELNTKEYLERHVEIQVTDNDSTIITYVRGGDLIDKYETSL
jgi:hypothetical protein